MKKGGAGFGNVPSAIMNGISSKLTVKNIARLTATTRNARNTFKNTVANLTVGWVPILNIPLREPVNSNEITLSWMDYLITMHIYIQKNGFCEIILDVTTNTSKNTNQYKYAKRVHEILDTLIYISDMTRGYRKLLMDDALKSDVIFTGISNVSYDRSETDKTDTTFRLNDVGGVSYQLQFQSTLDVWWNDVRFTIAEIKSKNKKKAARPRFLWNLLKELVLKFGPPKIDGVSESQKQDILRALRVVNTAAATPK